MKIYFSVIVNKYSATLIIISKNKNILSFFNPRNWQLSVPFPNIFNISPQEEIHVIHDSVTKYDLFYIFVEVFLKKNFGMYWIPVNGYLCIYKCRKAYKNYQICCVFRCYVFNIYQKMAEIFLSLFIKNICWIISHFLKIRKIKKTNKCEITCLHSLFQLFYFENLFVSEILYTY